MDPTSNSSAGKDKPERGGKRNRVCTRAKKRLMVRYGVQRTDRTAFTRNISETGLFIRTNAVLKPGSTIQVSIEFPEQTYSLWARVVWAKKVPAQLAHILDCGMGICFIDPPAEWIEFCRNWKSSMGLEE